MMKESPSRKEKGTEFPRNTSARYLQVLTTETPSWVDWWDVEIAVRAK